MRLVLLATIVAALAVPATASAGVVTTSTGSDGQVNVIYTGSPGEANTVDTHFQFFGHWIDIYDHTASIQTDDPNCILEHSYQAHCVLPLDSSVSPDTLMYGVQFVANLGDDLDSFKPSWGTDPFRAIVYGGAGADEITLGRNQGPLPSEAFGGDGNDVLTSQAKSGETRNVLFGDAGDDYINTADDAGDAVTCGDGSDTVRADQWDQVDADCETVRR